MLGLFLFFKHIFMKYFFSILLIFNINIFAAANEPWEYRIEHERFSDDRIIATRIVNGIGEDFYVLEPKDDSWNCKDFFEKPKIPLSRHLIGTFTLQSTQKPKRTISDHRMCLMLDWDNHLVRGSLKNLSY